MKTRRRHSVSLLFSTVFAVLAGSALLAYLSLRQEAAVTVAPAPALAAIEDAGRQDASGSLESFGALHVVDVEGDVRRRARPELPWQLVKTGERFQASEALETFGNARVTLRGFDQSELRFGAGALAVFDAVDQNSISLTLGRGLLDAQFAAQARSVKVKASDATYAEANQGRMRVLRGGDGHLQVSVLDGKAMLVSAGVTRHIDAGRFAQAQPGKTPQGVRPIPDTMLKVTASGERLVRRDVEIVRGQASKGALVLVGGELVAVDAKGRFHTEVKLREGVNRIDVMVYGLDGQQKQWLAPPLKRDTQAPRTHFGKPRFGSD